MTDSVPAIQGQAQKEPRKVTLSALEAFGERYGPYAFGVLLLIIVWFAIAAPQLERTRTDYEEFAKGAEVMRLGSEAMERASNSIENTARILEATSIRLEVISERLLVSDSSE